MKRFFTIIMATLLVAPFLQSCNTADTEQADKIVLATILPYWNDAGFACQMDNGETIYPGRVRIDYKANQEKAQRAVIYFSELSEPVAGFTYNADIFNIIDVTTKDIEVLTNAENDTLTTPVSVNAMVISGDYFNVDFGVRIDPYSNPNVSISLIDNQINGKTEYDEYYPLELKIKCTPEVNGKAGQIVNSTACFYIGAYSLERLGCKGYKITYKDLQSDSGDTKEILVTPTQN